ncbi:hypothetical protein ABZ519_19470 [Streptomyces collinus]|uniref:hypothetical protein n=1 Tax=Streptomyces collinus TaxID=42684 RepID=UPI0033FA3654
MNGITFTRQPMTVAERHRTEHEVHQVAIALAVRSGETSSAWPSRRTPTAST